MIVDKEGKLAGVITDGDLRRLMADEGTDVFNIKVGDVMTADCKKIRADALAAEATAIFHKYRIDDLPVVDADNKPIGLIDVQDIVTIKVVG
jgi:arabinose-5-phosphate isomerase